MSKRLRRGTTRSWTWGPGLESLNKPSPVGILVDFWIVLYINEPGCAFKINYYLYIYYELMRLWFNLNTGVFQQPPSHTLSLASVIRPPLLPSRHSNEEAS